MPSDQHRAREDALFELIDQELAFAITAYPHVPLKDVAREIAKKIDHWWDEINVEKDIWELEQE
jgi:hypothetical protein